MGKPSGSSLGRISLERYPALVAELEERTGLAIDYRRPGEWVIAVDEEHAEAERAIARWQRDMGLDVAEVPPTVARRRRPALPEPPGRGLVSPPTLVPSPSTG